MLGKYHETVGGDDYIEAPLVGKDRGAAITHILATIDGRVAIEDLLPPGVGDGQQILLDLVTAGEGGIVETRGDDDLLFPGPPFEGNDSIGVPLVEDVNVVTADRTQPAAERDEILIKAKEIPAVPVPLTQNVFPV